MPVVKAKALVVEEVSAPFKIVEVEFDDDKLREDEVLVRFHASGICHTDLGSWSGKIPSRFPCILGHEGAGEVLAVGGEIADLTPGDQVIASFCSCGGCGACQDEEPGKCDLFMPLNFGLLDSALQPDSIQYTDGGERKQASIKYFGQSSFASAMRVSRRSLTRIANGISPSVACALACGFQTGFSTVLEKGAKGAGAIRSFDHYSHLSKNINIEETRIPDCRAEERKDENVFARQTLLVSGIGAVGLGALVAAQLLGFGKVIAVDINTCRLELAHQAGATDVVDARDYSEVESFTEHVKALSIGQRGATLFIEASGAPVALTNGVLSLAVAGKAIILGSPPQTAVLDVPYGQVLANAWTIEGVLMGNAQPSVTIPFLVELLRQRKLDILHSIIQTYKPEQINDAVHDAEVGKVVKAVINWS